jgi:hypothetical protein
VVGKLTAELLAQIESGKRVIHETSGGSGSFVAEDRWTLRGTLWMPDHPLVRELGRDFFTSLCVKDLHPRGLVPFGELFDHAEPIVGFVDSHDVPITTDYAVLFDLRIGAGRLIVSSLPLSGNSAARHLRQVLIDHAVDADLPTRVVPLALVDAIRRRLVASTLDLTERDWQFRIEPQGGSPGDWGSIRVGRSWEGLGHPTLDGYARYRIEIDVAGEFVGQPLYLNIDGADDAYWVQFDGAECGSGGDVANKVTAFDQKASHRLTDSAVAGRHVLEVLVFDWYGAGGLHRPLSLSTAPLTREAEFIRGR